MALYLNESRRNTSTGRIERTGRLEVVGRSRNSSRDNGYRTEVVGTVNRDGSNLEITNPTAVPLEKGALIKARLEEESRAPAPIPVASVPTVTSGPQAIGSTVVNGGAGVIRAETTSGGFSTVVDGGAGEGTATYNFGKAVPVAGRVETPVEKKPGPSTNFIAFTGGTVKPSNASKPSVVKSFFGGLKTDVIGQGYAGKMGGIGKPVQSFTSNELAFSAGKVGRGIGEGYLTVQGIGLGFRAASIATKSAQATRIGSISGVRQAIPIAVPVAGAIGISVGARKIESNVIGSNPVFTNTGTNVREAIDVGSARYSGESGFFRSVGESTFFPAFSDRSRYEKTVGAELVSRGVTPARAREIASESFGTRATIRGRSDVAVGILGEVAGEATGRLTNTLLDARAARITPIVSSTSFSFRRGAGSALGGVVEGATQAASSDIQGTGRVSARNVAFGSAFGAATAGTAGFTLANLRIRDTKGSTRAANFIEGGLDAVDPYERPGDIAFERFQGSGRGFFGSDARIASARVNNRVFVATAPSFNNDFGGGARVVESSKSSRTASSGFAFTGARNSFVSTFSSAKNAVVTKVPSFSSVSSRSNPLSLNPSRSSSSVSSRGSALVSSRNNPFSLVTSRTRTTVPSFPSLVPSRGSLSVPARNNPFSLVTTRSSSLVSSKNNPFSLVTSKSKNLVPSYVPTKTNVPSKTNVPTRVFTPELPLLPFAGGSGGGLGFGRGRGKRGLSSFAPSFTALAFNIKGGRGKRSASGYGGLEVRGL